MSNKKEIKASLVSLDEVINIKTQLKKLHTLSMKYLTGKIELNTSQAKLLDDMYKILSDKLAPNAKSEEETVSHDINIIIKGPK